MGTMLPIDMQLSNEYELSRKFIDKYIEKEIREHPVLNAKVDEGVMLLEAWLNDTYYEAKEKRLTHIRGMDLEKLVMRLYVGIAYVVNPELYVSVTAQLAGRLGFSDKRDAIVTVAEIVAVLAHTDMFDITKASRQASLMIQSCIPLSDQLKRYARQSMYLPPMVCEPANLKHNFESPYLTHDDCVILKNFNAHSECVSLDVINSRNKVPLCLDYDFVSTVQEVPSKPLETADAERNFIQFREDSLDICLRMIKQGNRFYLHNKVDKRGRMYAQGYHITVQGSPYKKASVDLADGAVVSGVPDAYRI